MTVAETSSPLNRRSFLAAGALAPLALKAPRPRPQTPPPFTTSINIEIMFDRSVPKHERIRAVAAQQVKAYSFWRASDEEQKAMLEAQQHIGLACSCVVGSGKTGRTSGLTRPGAEQQYLDELALGVGMAQRFGGADAIVFPGARHDDIPWETQRENLIQGLRKAGDLAKEHGVHLVLEPLNRVESPEIAIVTAEAAFDVVSAAAHTHVKVDFDIYHLQLSEGNIINNLKLGLDEGWIRLVQIGDVPGRLEPGTGEINYPNIYRTLREAGYSGYVDSEHGTSSTPEHAIQVVTQMALES
ncbi:MAG: TIM barrel protein [Vicinamibacteraceae bacterium]